jgi:serine/threonine protein kinase
MSDSTNKDLKFTVHVGEFVEGTFDQIEKNDEKREKRIFHLKLDDSGSPKKIGDGSFGAVFEVEGTDEKPYALKILHDRDLSKTFDPQSGSPTILLGGAEFDIAKKRFRDEAKSMLNIQRVINERRSSFQISSIVDHFGYTEIFPAKEFSRYFEKQNITPSNYALVVELYHGTLKDLLELQRTGSQYSGYELLKRLPFNYRIKTLLPFLRSIASGLSIMHEAGYAHLDLKPANIFWREQKMGFYSAIGDLGYIKNISNEKLVNNPWDAALGTLHYRSPEQRDFRDECEVEILPSENADDIHLLTSDPKFRRTIAEPGDSLKFLKSIERNFRIRNLIPPHGKEEKTRIIIESEDKEPIAPDKLTQVVIYKNQGVRSDLFGFGAIIYDMLTCGDSPEKFYSYLAIDDVAYKNVAELIAKYQQIGTYYIQDSRYSSVFSSFLDRTEKNYKYAPTKIVSIILKCMLYRAQGTYFDISKKNNVLAFDLIADDLQSLEEEYHGLTTKENNPLISGKLPGPPSKKSGPPENLREEIADIQAISFTDKINSSFSKRVSKSVFRFTQIIQLIKSKIVNQEMKQIFPIKDDISEAQEFFFAELAPENIALSDNKLILKIIVYEKLKDYLKDLRDDVVHVNKIFYNPLNPFSPGEAIGYIRREIMLQKVDSSLDNKYAYKFVEASPFGDEIQPGDWIVTTSKNKQIRRITTVEGLHLTLSDAVNLIGDDKLDTTANSKVEENLKKTQSPRYDSINVHYYYKNIDVVSYYVSMLGIYIYQLFFVNIGSNTISKPIGVKSLVYQLKASPSQNNAALKSIKAALFCDAFEEGADIPTLIYKCYGRLTALYLALSLPNSKQFFENGNKSVPTIESIWSIWYKICDDISKCFKLRDGFFFDPTNNETELPQNALDLWLKEERDAQNEKNVDFEENINFNLNITQHIREILCGKHPLTRRKLSWNRLTGKRFKKIYKPLVTDKIQRDKFVNAGLSKG